MVYLIVQIWWQGELGGEGGGVGEDLSLTRTSSPPGLPKSIHLNPFHYTATKSSFTPLEITTGQDKIYGHTAQDQILDLEIGKIERHIGEDKL
jgi:hypothetical protein